MIELIPVGGYKEFGRNCTALNIDGTVIILDMGVQLEALIELNSSSETQRVSLKKMTEFGALPDLRVLGDLKDHVAAICISHAHLDHIGAVSYLSSKFKCPINLTPFAYYVLDGILSKRRRFFKNPIKMRSVNSTFRINRSVSIEFVNVTHSSPDSVIIVIKTKYGNIFYVNDFKFDDTPVIGRKTNYKRLEELSKNSLALIVDSLYADKPGACKSEADVKVQLEDIFVQNVFEGHVFVSTFSSHVGRLQSIMEIASKHDYEVILMGRSLGMYVDAAQKSDVTHSLNGVRVLRYSREMESFFKRIKGSDKKYLFLVTGHQGEPGSVLYRLFSNDWYDFSSKDTVIFSCNIIPSDVNIRNREILESKIRSKNVRLIKDVHVSGHGHSEDHKKLIELLKPRNIFPTHAGLSKLEALRDIAFSMGYTADKVHLLGVGDNFKLIR